MLSIQMFVLLEPILCTEYVCCESQEYVVQSVKKLGIYEEKMINGPIVFFTIQRITHKD